MGVMETTPQEFLATPPLDIAAVKFGDRLAAYLVDNEDLLVPADAAVPDPAARPGKEPGLLGMVGIRALMIWLPCGLVLHFAGDGRHLFEVLAGMNILCATLFASRGLFRRLGGKARGRRGVDELRAFDKHRSDATVADLFASYIAVLAALGVRASGWSADPLMPQHAFVAAWFLVFYYVFNDKRGESDRPAPPTAEELKERLERFRESFLNGGLLTKASLPDDWTRESSAIRVGKLLDAFNAAVLRADASLRTLVLAGGGKPDEVTAALIRRIDALLSGARPKVEALVAAVGSRVESEGRGLALPDDAVALVGATAEAEQLLAEVDSELQRFVD